MNDTPDLNAIQAFIAVAEAGSFATAARSAGLTRSALGKAVVRLETRLGTRLLHRTTRRISLTVDGAEYLARMRQILAEISEAEENVRQDQPVPRGVLRLAVPDAYGRLCVMPVLRAFLRDWPELAADVSFTDRPVDLVREGIDLAIRINSAEAGADVVGRVVARSAVVLCAAPGYLMRCGMPGSADAVAAHDRIQFNGRAGEPMPWTITMADGSHCQIKGRGRIVLDSAEAIRDMAVAGFGIAQLPRFLVEEDLAAARLSVVLPYHPVREIPISVLYPNRRHLPARVRLFIDRLAAILESSTERSRPARAHSQNGTADIEE